MSQAEALQRISEFVGPKGDRWVLDESLKAMAEELVEKYSEDLGHVKLGHVVFVRAVGVSSTKWFGKCRYVGAAPTPIIARHIVATLGSLGMLDVTQLRGLEADLMDIRYIITINDTALRVKAGTDENAEFLRTELERITLHHEMLHIDSTMEGLVTHDTQDFAKIIETYGVHWSMGAIQQVDGLTDAVQGLAKTLKGGGVTVSFNMPRGMPENDSDQESV